MKNCLDSHVRCRQEANSNEESGEANHGVCSCGACSSSRRRQAIWVK
jgi:hypothetical protein